MVERLAEVPEFVAVAVLLRTLPALSQNGQILIAGQRVRQRSLLAMAANSVDLPLPLRPTTPTRAPGGISKVAPWISARPPRARVNPWARIIGADLGELGK